MANQRKIKRRHLIYYLEVYNNSTGDLLGHLADLSEDGLMITSSQSFPAGKVIELRVKIPENSFGIENFVVSAKAKWSGKDYNPDLNITGFQFLEKGPELNIIVESLIEFIGFGDKD